MDHLTMSTYYSKQKSVSRHGLSLLSLLSMHSVSHNWYIIFILLSGVWASDRASASATRTFSTTTHIHTYLASERRPQEAFGRRCGNSSPQVQTLSRETEEEEEEENEWEEREKGRKIVKRAKLSAFCPWMHDSREKAWAWCCKQGAEA